ncbi:MAG: metal ABC transporter permease [Treponema sp.]|jgi:zinc transport system permease protein|nr:metal ABC transporter permease [Treponema sp.]
MNDLLAMLLEMFSYAFLVRAFVVGALVSICSALLGVSLVLKRYSMIGDGLSHVGFGSLAIATALNLAPLTVSIPIVIAAAFLLLRLGEKTLIKGDAAIALVSTSSLALGVIIISQTTGMNTDVCNYLFGSILAMNKHDVYLSVALSITTLVLFVLFYHKLFAITFDETFAQATGVRTDLYNMLIAFLTAITIVVGMRMMGAMLISALIIFPALTSMRLFKQFKSVSVCSVCVSICCFFIGIVISYVYAMPTGASVVLANILAFILFWTINSLKKRRSIMKNRSASALAALICVLLAASCGNRKELSLLEAASLAEAPAAAFAAAKSNNAGTASVQLPPRNETAGADKAKNGGSGGTRSETIEIKEKMFIAQVNDVYLNPEDYFGKTIKLEGLFKLQQYADKNYYFVLRYGPGCCGNDGNAGFEVAWDDSFTLQPQYPKEDVWVEATGVLKSYEEDGFPYLYIALTSLTLPDTRGAEFVTQ